MSQSMNEQSMLSNATMSRAIEDIRVEHQDQLDKMQGEAAKQYEKQLKVWLLTISCFLELIWVEQTGSAHSFHFFDFVLWEVWSRTVDKKLRPNFFWSSF